MKIISKLLLFCVLSLFPLKALSGPGPTTGTLTFLWNNGDTNSPTIVTNFIFYWGVTPRTYTNSVNADMTLQSGSTTNYTFTLTNLVRGTTYYFSVTAVGPYGLESDYSNEVTNTIPKKAGSPKNLTAQ